MLEEIGAKEWLWSLIFISSEKSCPGCKLLLKELLLHVTLSIYLPSFDIVPESLFERSHPIPYSWSVLPLCYGYFLSCPEWCHIFLCSRLVLLWMISSAFSTENIKRWLKTQYWELIALKLLIVGNFYILLAFQKSRYEITQLEKPQIEEFGDICVIFLPCAEVLSTTSIMEGWRKHSSVVRNFVFLLS